MRRIFIISLLVTSFFQQSTFASEQATPADEEAKGFGMGAIIGGLVAGPPGIIVGAAMGSAIAHDSSQKTDSLAELKQQLSAKDDELRAIVQQVAELNSEHQKELKKVALEKSTQADQFLTENLALSVFFRTNESDLEPRFEQSIEQLVGLIKDRPDIRIYINAYADMRGSRTHNYQLSEGRALTVTNKLIASGIDQNRIQFHAFGESDVDENNDLDGFAFDRRVDIELSIHDEA